MTCIFIYNPVGGKGKIAKKLGYIVRELKEKYEEVDVYATKCAGDMTQIAHDAVGKYDTIVFAGGDGSFHEVLQGVAPFEQQPTLAYIPSGTVNDVAHSLRIPTKLKRALKVIKTGVPERIDCMKLNEEYAIYVVTTGAFTGATYATSQNQKNHIGRLAYGLEGMRHHLKFQPFEITCQNAETCMHTDSCILIAFINSKYVAGFPMNRHADLQDGEMEVAIVERKKKGNIFKRIGGYLSIFALFLFGYRAKLRHVTHFKGKAFDIDVNEDIAWNIDGEKGERGKIHIEILPKKVKILLPYKEQ